MNDFVRIVLLFFVLKSRGEHWAYLLGWLPVDKITSAGKQFVLIRGSDVFCDHSITKEFE